MMVYRKSVENDCRAIYTLICELEQKELPYDLFEVIYNEQLQDRHFYCLLCQQDDQLISALNMRFELQLHHVDRIAEILEFTVAAAYRSKGIGRIMLARICQIALDNGCSQVEVACSQFRKDAHRFYQREGMQNSHFKFTKMLVV